jgi:hypothetical protein
MKALAMGSESTFSASPPPEVGCGDDIAGSLTTRLVLLAISPPPFLVVPATNHLISIQKTQHLRELHVSIPQWHSSTALGTSLSSSLLNSSIQFKPWLCFLLTVNLGPLIFLSLKQPYRIINED